MMHRVLGLLALSLLIGSAHPGHAWDPDGPLEISITHPAFSERNGILYLGSDPYTGIVIVETAIKHAKLAATDIPSAILTGRYSYKNGLKDGLWYEWHKNGFMKKAFHYTKGLLSGIQQEWHSNGMQKFKADYIMGAEYGLEQHWNKSGKLTKELVHDPIPEEE